MKRIATLFLFFISLCIQAQQPFKGNFYDAERKIGMRIDLYEESVNVPGMEMFGPMNGLLYGDVYGTWMITSFTIKDKKEATLRFSSDFGSDTQEIQLIIKNDSICTLSLKEGVVIKRVVDRKLVKIADKLTMKRKK